MNKFQSFLGRISTEACLKTDYFGNKSQKSRICRCLAILGQNKTLKNQFKYSLYSLNTLSDVTTERCPFLPFCTRAHTSRLQRCDESLATCGRFDRYGIWTPYLLH